MTMMSTIDWDYQSNPPNIPVPSYSSLHSPLTDKDHPMSLINSTVAPFKAQAFHNGKFVEVTQDSLKGKWSVIVFTPAAFTFNCPTEVEDAAENYADFQKAGAEIYIVTTDTQFSH